MPWLNSCLCHQPKRKPRISPPLHLLLKPEGDIQAHCFRVKVFRKPRPCHVCHQPILNRGSVCRVCKYACHHACENKDDPLSRYADTSLTIHQQWEQRKIRTFPTVANVIEDIKLGSSDRRSTHSNDDSTRNPSKNKPTPLMTPTRPAPKSDREKREVMDLSYVTERIIALWFPEGVSPQAFRQGHHQASHMLTTKHANNYMVFNLSEPRRAARSQHERIRELGWLPGLAPPLERLCSICKDIETWLSGDTHRIAVLHARGSRERIGVVVAAFMHYSNICGTADQALDRFAMKKFLDDKVGELEQPSSRRYLDYFSGLLSGNIRVNSDPLYLTHVTVLGAPAFEAQSEGVACRAFLKVYEGLVPVYTSGVHRVSPGTRQFTVNVAGDRGRQGLQLHGDVLVKCYHRHPTRREVIFACQFHTCAITDYTLSFTRQELDSAAHDLRFPFDGAVELHFSSTPAPRLPAPAPTPAVPVDSNDDPIVRWDSYGDLNLSLGLEPESDSDNHDGPGPEVSHTYGPLDGSIYATVSKKASPVTTGATTIGSPRTVSMDSGISSAGNGLQNNTSNASSSSPAPAPNIDTQRALDELLREMLITVESIPDIRPPSSALPRSQTYAGPSTPRSHPRQPVTSHSTIQSSSAASGVSVLDDLESVAYIDDPDDIPYHARQDSRPFTYGAAPGPEMLRGQPGLSSPSLVRKASFGKSNGYVTTPKSADNTWTRNVEQSWTTTPRNTRSWDTTDSSYRWRQNSAPVTRKSPEYHDSLANGGLTNGSVTWLQRQQQKLRERREAALRLERRPQEARLISELRAQRSASHRDGYTSDTTHFPDDDEDDLTIPLHVQTSPPRSSGSAPASPLPRRGFQNGTTERPFVAVKRAHEQNRKFIDSLRDDSTSSWRTASISDDPGSPSRTNSPRPVTPAFPVHPRTPYSNGSVVQFDLNGLPPKSPTAQRKERSPSPGVLDGYLQYSPKSTISYQGQSQRSSVHSNSEPPQEVSPAHVKFVRDTSKYWYKPTISREQAINMLRNEPPGTFVVRDSNTFPGAFGLALKVASHPSGKAGSDELVRHFLIEPTSRGVRLKGCANEPVFSTLSALVYQHSITNLALPTRLLLPEGDKRVESPSTVTAQQLLAQGAACNVLYLLTVETESLTGPQAVRKAVNQLFHTKPLPIATIVHFKVSSQGITLTDNKRQLFFRRHYPVATVSYCGLDPDDHRWSHSTDASGVPISSHRCFGFVARKPASKTDNQCHVFAELEPEQPATAIVNFVSKVMMTTSTKPNIV